MRVLEEGKLQEHIGRCTNCNAKLAVTRTDIRFGWFSAYIICPICKEKIAINNEDLYRFGYEIEE